MWALPAPQLSTSLHPRIPSAHVARLIPGSALSCGAQGNQRHLTVMCGTGRTRVPCVAGDEPLPCLAATPSRGSPQGVGEEGARASPRGGMDKAPTIVCTMRWEQKGSFQGHGLTGVSSAAFTSHIMNKRISIVNKRISMMCHNSPSSEPNCDWPRQKVTLSQGGS